MYVAPLDLPVDSVQSVLVETNGVNKRFELDRSGSEIKATCNGKAIDYANTFVSTYFKCITINADGYDENLSEPGDREATVTITRTDGETVELALYERDSSTMYLFVNGEPLLSGKYMFYTDASSLTELRYRLQGTGD